MRNSDGSFRTTREADMEAFDSLPERLRSQLANAPFNYASQRALEALRQGPTAEAIIARMRIQFSRDIQSLARASYGPTHPQA